MKSWGTWLLATLVLLLAAPHAPASERYLGGQIGDPTGITVLQTIGEHEAVVAAIGVALIRGENPVQAHVDWIHRFAPLEGGHISFYAGLGLRGQFGDDDDDSVDANEEDDDFQFGPRAPLGALWHTEPDASWHIFFELAPGIDVVDDAHGTLDASVGIRWRL